MGGSGPKKPKKEPLPPKPEPIDYDKMYQAANRAGIETIKAQEESLRRLYPEMVGLQLGTARQIAGELDNEYLGKIRGVLDNEITAASKPNEIEAELQRQATSDLALGRSLNPEEERAAQQSARSAMAARGLGTGAGAVAAEVLNRSAYADARQADRRQFALGANQLDLARRQRLIGLATDYAGTDPYARALGPAFGLGTATLNQGSGLIGQTFGNALEASGNVASFNTNMAASERNNVRTNNAALQAAYITGGASNNAGWMSMLGGMAQGGGQLGGAAISKYSDRRMKKDIKPLGKGGAGGVLGLTTYEYRYKDGDGSKHVGFMAQDVQKVLPEAVEEVDYKGQRRLAIKPKVIGQAIAEVLASAQDDLFKGGYTVGSGK